MSLPQIGVSLGYRYSTTPPTPALQPLTAAVPWVAGTLPPWHRLDGGGNSGGVPATLSRTNRIWLVPWMLGVDARMTDYVALVRNSGGVGSLFRVGLYTTRASDKRPNMRLLDTGDLDGTLTTASQGLTGLNLLLPAGMYWSAWLPNNALINVAGVLQNAGAGLGWPTGFVGTGSNLISPFAILESSVFGYGPLPSTMIGIALAGGFPPSAQYPSAYGRFAPL